MTQYGLNPTERRARDILKNQLGARATVTSLRQTGDCLAIEVVSPNDFDWTADRLCKLGPEVAAQTNCNVQFNLMTWVPKPTR
jgi:hypothetical protein